MKRMNLQLDYGHSPVPPLSLGLLLIGGLAVLLLAGYQWQLSHAIQQRQGEIGKIRQELRSQAPPVRPLARGVSVDEEIQRAKVVVQQLLLPWDRLFAAIEASDRKGIALLSIQPDAEKRVIVIGGEAKNFEVMLDYIRQLEHSRSLVRVHLTTHEVQKKDPQHPVRFRIAAEWGVAP